MTFCNVVLRLVVVVGSATMICFATLCDLSGDSAFARDLPLVSQKSRLLGAGDPVEDFGFEASADGVVWFGSVVDAFAQGFR